jgi:hypothetical protein
MERERGVLRVGTGFHGLEEDTVLNGQSFFKMIR